MRLSTATRDGSKLCGQAFGKLEDQQGNRCALGAAFYVRTRRAYYSYMSANETFPILAQLRGLTMGRAVAKLNDELRWSRQRIADWVEHLENHYSIPEDVSSKPLPFMEELNVREREFVNS